MMSLELDYEAIKEIFEQIQVSIDYPLSPYALRLTPYTWTPSYPLHLPCAASQPKLFEKCLSKKIMKEENCLSLVTEDDGEEYMKAFWLESTTAHVSEHSIRAWLPTHFTDAPAVCSHRRAHPSPYC